VCEAPFGALTDKPPYFFGSKANGSSLPNCSGLPVVLSLSVRACDRWIASKIMSGVAVGCGGLLTAVVGAGEVDVLAS
jgi:hypothetical protein